MTEEELKRVQAEFDRHPLVVEMRHKAAAVIRDFLKHPKQAKK